MSLDGEFKSRWVAFHKDLDRAQTLMGLYPDDALRKVFKNNEEATPDLNEDFIRLLQITDERILRVFREWRRPGKTGRVADEIFNKHIGGPLVSALVYTYWKYADVVRILGAVLDGIQKQVLLDQAIVAGCTAYERFLKDMIPWVLKNHPPAAKAYLGTMSKQVKELGKFDFEPMKNVDAVFLEDHPSGRFPLREVVEFYSNTLKLGLYPTEQEAAEIQRIFEVRNAIVHSAGRADDLWRTRTRGAELKTDRNQTREALARIDAAVHYGGARIFELLNLDDKKAPFKAPDPEPSFRWDLIDAIGGSEAPKRRRLRHGSKARKTKRADQARK